ncbi:hypothetical protein HDU81_010007, partial [Chytriomyces hyalinus]
TRVEAAELEDIFNKFGKVSRLDVKRGQQYNFGFVEFEDPKDAQDAQRDIDGKELSDGSRVVVEFAKGGARAGGRDRDRNSNECFKCGKEGHFARDCREGGGGDRYGGGRGGYDRDRRSPPRRRYSRSPPRRRYDDDRRRDDRDRSPVGRRDDRDRSPPPRREDRSPPRRDERDRSPPPARKDDRSPRD